MDIAFERGVSLLALPETLSTLNIEVVSEIRLSGRTTTFSSGDTCLGKLPTLRPVCPPGLSMDSDAEKSPMPGRRGIAV